MIFIFLTLCEYSCFAADTRVFDNRSHSRCCWGRYVE